MNNIVIWSGGFDSTYMLYNLIENGDIKDECDLVSLAVNMCGEKQISRECAARTQLLEVFKEKYPEISFRTHTINVTYPEFPCCDLGSNGLSQPILWVCNLIPFIDSGSRIYFGYISDDEAIPYLHINQDVVDLFIKYRDLHDVKIEYPLKFWSKRLILTKVFKDTDNPIHNAMLKYCTTCENLLENDYCGDCVPCKNLIFSLLQVIVHNQTNKELVNNVYEFMNNHFHKVYRLVTEDKPDESNQ